MTKDDRSSGAPVDQFFDPVIIWRRWRDRARMIRDEMERHRKIKAAPGTVSTKNDWRPSGFVKWFAGMIAAIIAGLIVAWAVGQIDLP